jgi:hypothetical protein
VAGAFIGGAPECGDQPVVLGRGADGDPQAPGEQRVLAVQILDQNAGAAQCREGARGIGDPDQQEVGVARNHGRPRERGERRGKSAALGADRRHLRLELAARRQDHRNDRLRQRVDVVRGAHLVELADPRRVADRVAEPRAGKPARRDADAAQRRYVTSGMSESEIRARLGSPDVTAGGKGRGAARWTYLPAPGDPDTITVITFANGTATGVERKVIKK